MVRFDAYTATTRGVQPHDLVPLFDPITTGLQLRQGKGFHQFAERVSMTDDSGSEVGAVSWGGAHGDRVMVEVKGERTPALVERLRAHCWHRVTRVDSCADFDAPGAWNRLLRPVMAVKRKHRIFAEKRGDWTMPEHGRTYMVGAASSVTRMRLYEKGKQPEYRHLDRLEWVRAEVQARPAKDAKEAYATLSPLEVWGASAWSRELAGLILAEHVDPHPAGTVYKLTERDRALSWMAKQYGHHLLSLKEDCGSWEAVGLTISEFIREAMKKGH